VSVEADNGRRAHRLGAILAAAGEEPTAWAAGLTDGLVASPERLGVAPGDPDVLAAASGDDRELATSCLTAAHEFRARQWEALSRVLALLDLRDGPLDARVADLPTETVVALVLDLADLGWLVDGAEGDPCGD